jgi:hypothetical protein
MRGEFTVVLDACVLVNYALCDTLLRLGETPSLYALAWTDDILDEATRTLKSKLNWPEDLVASWEQASYMFNVLLYVEANPLRARLVVRAEDWPWSSLSQAPVYAGLVEVPRPKLAPWDRGEHWHEAVNAPLSLPSLDSLRQSVARGTPQGQPQWIANLVSLNGMESTVRPRGRPRKPISKE